MRAHLVFIGGTGACCAKAFLAAGAIGAAAFAPQDSQITVHTIDPDTDGTAKTAVGALRAAFLEFQRAVPGVFPCRLETGNKQHRPYDGTGRLPDRVTVPNLFGCTPQTGGHRILQLLLDDDQIAKDLTSGFYGWPGVGAAIWERWNPEELPGALDFAKAGQGEDVRIILVGSIFGGTGSSGIPTLARRYRQLISQAPGKEAIRLQALVLTPYFQVDPGDRPAGEDLVREADNKFRTRHVLEDVVAQSRGFDSVYFLGRKDVDQTPFPPDCYSLDAQKNPTTLIERVAAWTLWGHLLGPGPTPEKGTNQVFSVSDEGGSLASWDSGAGARFEGLAERLAAMVALLGLELGDWRSAKAFGAALDAWLDLAFGGQGRRTLEADQIPMRSLAQLRKVRDLLADPERKLPAGENWEVLFRDLAGRHRYEFLLKAAGPVGLKESLKKWRESPESASEALWRELNRA